MVQTVFFTTKRACPLEILRMFIYWQEGTLLTESFFAGVSDLFRNMLSDITLNVYRLGLRLWLVFEEVLSINDLWRCLY